MRDLAITLIVFGALPWILSRPYVGVLVWSWLSYMNPHRLSWGFAFTFPFAQIAAAATLIGMLISPEPKRIPWMPILFVWLAFIVWTNITTFFALNPDGAMIEWDRFMKIQLMSFATLILMVNRKRIELLVWVIVISIGFFGVKGGVFSMLTGGQYLVFGPLWSFIQDNNAMALALIMVLPLMRYLQVNSNNKWISRGLTAAMALTALAIFTSHSRGALLAGSVMAFVLMLKSRAKVRVGFGMLVAIPLILMFLPPEWFDRMATIRTYQQDESAMGRINAWWFAYEVALDRPLVGGGFRTFTRDLFVQYAPAPFDWHDAHSIYFEVLGEQGFVGLALFLMLGFMSLRLGTWIIRHARNHPDLRWATDLGAMLQVSLIGYAVGGAFLGLAYFDLYYHLVVLIILVKKQVENTLTGTVPKKVDPVPGEPGSQILPYGQRRERGDL